jgi:glycerol kinase
MQEQRSLFIAAQHKNHCASGAESIGYQVKDVLELMVAEASIPLQCIHADGGAIRNRFLMQFVADMIRYPVRVSDIADLSALGVVFCSYLGIGSASSLADIDRLSRSLDQYEAKMSPEKVDELYQGWKTAVQRVL